jgi:hypothetical protein
MCKWGTYMWTASAAGWLVLGLVGSGEVCYLVAVGCGVMAYLWRNTIGKW